MTEPRGNDRLARLAEFVGRFREPGASFAADVTMRGKGTSEDPFVMPSSEPSQLGLDFHEMA
jgi:hypothetical protein